MSEQRESYVCSNENWINGDLLFDFAAYTILTDEERRELYREVVEVSNLIELLYLETKLKETEIEFEPKLDKFDVERKLERLKKEYKVEEEFIVLEK